jgi:hypothetical protein
VARIPGPSPEAPFVLFGGHIDAWHHGATDEGASNGLMLELARAFYRNRDSLRRGLVVAWWPGHSNARYGGSTWFADHYFEEMRKRCIAYVNVDVIGHIDAKSFGAATTVSLADLAARVLDRREGEAIEPRRPGRNSDQSFNGIGVPLLQLYHSRAAEDGGDWYWHTPDDTIDKVDFQILKRDADLYVDALAELLAAPLPPVDLTAEVQRVGEAIAARESESEGRFDLQEATARQAQLLQLAQDIEERLAGDVEPGPALDLALIRLLRPLHRVLYVPLSPYHPDPGVGWTLLPGLTATRTLAEEEPETDRYRFAEATLIRERNRLLEALDDALEEATRLRESLG